MEGGSGGDAAKPTENRTLDNEDNLPSRQKSIIERLTSIRSNKQRILLTLRGLKENLKEDEEPDKELIAKMIGSYDALSAQEEEYMKLIQNIVSIRENAAEDVQQEITELHSKCAAAEAAEAKSDGDVLDGVSIGGAKAAEDAVTAATAAEDAVTAATAAEDAVAAASEKTEQEKADEQKAWEEVQDELATLGSVTTEAVAASVMNEKLVETLQLHREKRAALQRIRQQESETQRGAANEALEQVEMARIQVATEQEQIERKRRTLERLRKEALRRGIKIGPGSASEPDILVEPPPEPKSATEAKLRAKLNAKKKQNEEGDKDDSPPVPENLAPVERIPPIVGSAEGGDDEHLVAAGEGGGVASKRKKKGKKARELAKQKRDAISSSIRERLATIQARKQRISDIRAQLMRPVANAPQDMDETFRRAQEQLKSLTAMREQLEEMRDKGDELPEETARMLDEQLADADAEVGARRNFVPMPDSEIRAETEQATAAVRDEFERVMNASGDSSAAVGGEGPAVAAQYHTGVSQREDSIRLVNIERILMGQQKVLEDIAAFAVDTRGQTQQCACRCTASAQSPPSLSTALLRHCLLTAEPQLLAQFGQLVVDLSNGLVVQNLDATLARLLEYGDEKFNRMSSENEDWQSATGANRDECSIHSPTPENAAQPTTTTAEKDSSGPAKMLLELPTEAKERSPDLAKMELAKRRLSTGRAKLQKQRTLEKVRYITGEETTEERKEEEEENLKGLGRDICLIIEAILPWLKENAEKTASEELMNELRNEVLRSSASICFPEGPSSDLFESQLRTIVDDTLSQYYGEQIGSEREQLVFDISEILYNELAFFQLMHDIDSLAVDVDTTTKQKHPPDDRDHGAANADNDVDSPEATPITAAPAAQAIPSLPAAVPATTVTVTQNVPVGLPVPETSPRVPTAPAAEA